jgi:hypothetical protein
MVRLFIPLALAVVGCSTDTADIEIRACNDTGTNMTSFSWGSEAAMPLDVLACTQYRKTTADICDETSITFTTAADTYTTQRTDCYRNDYGVSPGRWTIHVRIEDAQFHAAGVCVTADN